MFKYLIGASFALTMLAAGPAFAGVAGSPHDLTLNPGEEVCVYCHTPHNASNVGAPLWNRSSTVTVFTMYSSPTANMVRAGTPQGVSMACLSCHDGTVAYNSIANVGSGVTNSSNMLLGSNPQYAVGAGGNLADDHPISVTYDTTVDAEFNAITSGKVGSLPLYGASSNQVECGSCHNPHDTTNGKFLRVSNANSALCTTCHIK